MSLGGYRDAMMQGMAPEMSKHVNALPNSGMINPFQATPNERL